MTGGTKVLSDRIVVRVTAEQGQNFLDKMIGLIESAKRQRTPNWPRSPMKRPRAARSWAA